MEGNLLKMTPSDKIKLALKVNQMVMMMINRGESPLIIISAKLKPVPGTEGGTLQGFGEAWITDRSEDTMELVRLAHFEMLNSMPSEEYKIFDVKENNQN